MRNIAFSEEELFEAIVSEGIAQGVNNKEAYDELVDGIITDRLRVGELNDDQNLDGVADRLKERWGEFQEQIV
jgi:hypothetical protein